MSNARESPGPRAESVPNLTGRRAAGEVLSEARRHGGFRAVGITVSKTAGPIIARKPGGLLARLKSEWAAIVGADWDRTTWPVALGRDGAVKLRVAPGRALDVQHRAPLLVERINQYLGRGIVTRLMLVQGPLPSPPPPPRPSVSPLPAAAARALDEQLSGIEDAELRSALARLGVAVISAERNG